MSGRQGSEHFLRLPVGDFSVGLEPFPGPFSDQGKFFEPSHHGFAGHSVLVREQYDVTPGEMRLAVGYPGEAFCHPARRSQKRAGEAVRVSFLAGAEFLVLGQDFRLLPRRTEVPEFVGRGLPYAVDRVVGVQQYAGPDAFFIGEQSRYPVVDLPRVHADSQSPVEQRYDVRNRSRPGPQPVAQFLRVALGLCLHVARKDGALRRISPRPARPEHVLKLGFRLGEPA